MLRVGLGNSVLAVLVVCDAGLGLGGGSNPFQKAAKEDFIEDQPSDTAAFTALKGLREKEKEQSARERERESVCVCVYE